MCDFRDLFVSFEINLTILYSWTMLCLSTPHELVWVPFYLLDSKQIKNLLTFLEECLLAWELVSVMDAEICSYNTVQYVWKRVFFSSWSSLFFFCVTFAS